MTDAVTPTLFQANITSAQLAQFYGVTDRTVAEWRKAGVPYFGSGKNIRYDLKAVVEWKESQAIRKATEKLDTRIGEMDKDEAVVRKLAAQATLEEIKVAEARDQLVNIADSDKEIQRLMSICRGLLSSFPSRLAPWILNLPDELTARELVEKQVKGLMLEMAAAAFEPMEPEVNIDEE